MAYVALYRAYRPQKFMEVVGQRHIIKTLQNAIKLNKVAHAYLFCGPRGTGKTTLAKIMAKALNCENGPTIEPCCECEMCKGIAKGTISDVVEIDAASNNGVEDVRAIRDTVKFLPAQGKYKVYIIDEVHMLSQAAFNALLKTLEEPPAHVIFILATTEPYKLPNTILSRCQRFDFQSISIPDILERLRIVAQEENISIDEDALNQIATSAEGGMRDALSLFDQTISYSINTSITLDDVLAVSGNISYFKIIELLNACIGEDETKAITILDGILSEGKEVPRVINDIILFLRDVLLFKNNSVIEEKIMYKNESFIDLANKLPKNLIYKWLDILNKALLDMRFSTQKRAYMELAILKMNDKKLNEEAMLVERVESLEKTIAMLSQRPNILEEKVQKPKNEFNINIPSRSELEKISKAQVKEDIPSDIEIPKINIDEIKIEPNISEIEKNIPTVKETESLEITIKDIEAILNNASKSKKEELNAVWNKISERYSNTLAIQILINGKVVAASSDSFIVELKDTGFCNRVMSYENYVKIIEIFNEFNLNIKDYICVPTAVWSKIIADYRAKYNPVTNPHPQLDDIKIGIKRRIVPTRRNNEDEIIEQVKDLFDDDVLKVEE